MNAREITDALQLQYSTKHICFKEVKDGSTWCAGGHYRIDFLAIKKTWSPVTISAMEIKVDRSDFNNDEKWPEYMKLCNRFYWVCPTGLIAKEEVDAQCGLIYVNPKTSVVTTRKAAPYRKNDLDPYLLLYLILWRLGESGEENALRERKRKEEDMADSDKFGKHYKIFHDEKLYEANERVVVAEEQAKQAREAVEKIKKTSTVLQELEKGGVNIHRMATKGLLENPWALRNLTAVKDDIIKLRNKLTDTLEVIGDEIE